MLAYTKIEIVQTSLHTVYTWKAAKLKQVYTKFAKPRQKFTLSLHNQDKSLHKVWKNKKKVYTKFEKRKISLSYDKHMIKLVQTYDKKGFG